MKTRFLLIIAGLLVLLPMIGWLGFNASNEVMVDGITTSAIVVMVITIIFSIISWVLFSWASGNIKPMGILLSIIMGAALVFPFIEVLGPMSGILVGIMGGFVAFMIQKKMTNPTENRYLIIAAIFAALTYTILFTAISVFQTSYVSHIWDS